MSTSRASLCSPSASSRDILTALSRISQRLQEDLSDQRSKLLLVFHYSQWRCLTDSYSLVIPALDALLDRACSCLEPVEQDIMWERLFLPLMALLEALQEAEMYMRESQLPSSSNSRHSWLWDRALKLCTSTDVVDVHLHRLLWTSSVVCEQLLRSAHMDGMASLISEQTRELCKIWGLVDANEDLSSAQSILSRIMTEEDGEPRRLAAFVLQKLSCFVNMRHAKDIRDLPECLWVDPDDLKRNQEILGQGGYGKVQQAEWFGCLFAVKDFFYVEDDANFASEAIIQAQICHPNVIPLVCCSRKPSMSQFSLVMELMQQDLRLLLVQRLKAGMHPPFPLLLAVDLMLQIAQGMEYLHSDSVRVIHRDLKSSNILARFPNQVTGHTGGSQESAVGPQVHLKIADFGMSKTKLASSRFTTRPVGTYAWRAPELFEANPEDTVEDSHTRSKYTNKVDVYSYGLICYEILTGKIPFEGPHIRKRVIAGERPSIPAYCPLALSSFIQQCWHAAAAQRPTFTQICRILRYFKACILILDHDKDSDQCMSKYHDWLYHPLHATIYARIDGMLQSLVQQHESFPRPHSLAIPLEMHCCREILQHQDEIEGDINRECREASSPTVASAIGFEGSASMRSTFQAQENTVVLEGSSQISKGYFDRIPILKSLKRLIRINGTPINSDSQDSHGDLGMQFTYEEITTATNNFSLALSGTGLIFRGKLTDGRSIAVRVVHEQSKLSNVKVRTEKLKIVVKIRHENIVPFLGWCQHKGKLMLVYTYLPNGDLGKYIYGVTNSPGPMSDWQKRYKVVCQVAAALKYLHQDMKLVHQAATPRNILLDAEWNALLGDCGLGVFLLEGHFPQSYVVDQIYMAPEITNGGQRHESPATNIYSYGMLLLQIGTGRPHDAQLDVWVQAFYNRGKVMLAADAVLEGNFDRMEMERVLVLGLACTNGRPQDRPTIQEVMAILSGASMPPPPQARSDRFHT